MRQIFGQRSTQNANVQRILLPGQLLGHAGKMMDTFFSGMTIERNIQSIYFSHDLIQALDHRK